MVCCHSTCCLINQGCFLLINVKKLQRSSMAGGGGAFQLIEYHLVGEMHCSHIEGEPKFVLMGT